MQENVDFILIAGDLFDTPLPSYDVLSNSTSIIKKCKDKGIRIYVVPGSHDYSPSEKTFITVLENAGLLVNVAKIQEENEKVRLIFTEDKSGAKITGIMGKAGSLEREYFKFLDRESLEKEEGYKIFLFHSAIEEFKPKHLKEMAAVPLSMIPKNFDYYATGHVHHAFQTDNIVFPGVLFPTETKELENYESGIHIIDTEKKTNAKIPVKLFDTVTVSIKADEKNPVEVEKDFLEQINVLDIKGKLLIIKAIGSLGNGNPSDINFTLIKDVALKKGAFSVKKNFNKLKSKDFQEASDSASLSIETIEQKIIDEYSTNKNLSFTKNEVDLVKNIMFILNDEKHEGETVATFEERINENMKRSLEL